MCRGWTLREEAPWVLRLRNFGFRGVIVASASGVSSPGGGGGLVGNVVATEELGGCGRRDAPAPPPLIAEGGEWTTAPFHRPATTCGAMSDVVDTASAEGGEPPGTLALPSSPLAPAAEFDPTTPPASVG